MTTPGLRDADERNLIAEEIRALRDQRGWSQQDLAERIQFSLSTVKHLETGYRAPTEEQSALLDEVFELPGLFQRLRLRHRNVPLSAGFRPFAPHEAEAHTLKTFQHTMVPGLFQTEAYVTELIRSHPGLTESDIQERIAARLRRQLILDGEPPPWMWVVLDEQVLRRPVGGPVVMAEQLRRLGVLARQPRNTIQVLPFTRTHPGLNGAFVIAEGDDGPVAYLETALDGMVHQDAPSTRSLAVTFDALRTEALSGEASLALIDEGAEQWQALTRS
jgi:transcriptional regulator with XRE-family HTH domain